MEVLIRYVVPAIHVVACVFLIVVVLLQQGKGADVGALFGGGGSQSLFGASGAGNFLTRLTTGMAIAFMATSLILTYGQTHALHSGLLDRIPANAGAPAASAPVPAAPEGATAPEAADKPADAPAPEATPPPAAPEAPAAQ